MLKLKKIQVAAGLACVALTAAGCGGVASSSGSGTVELRAANLLPPEDAQSEMIQWFMDELEKRSDGEVETEVVHAGGLVAGNDTLPALQQNRAEAGNVVPAYFPAELPLNNVNMVPIADADQSARLRAFQDLADNVEAWEKEFEDNGLVLVGYLPNTSSTATFNKPVESLDDIDGLKLRVPAQTLAATWEQFGVEPVFMASEEVYESVERGIVNGTTYPMGTQVSTGIAEVTSVITHDVGQNGGSIFAVSKTAYDKLSDDAKDIFAELQGEWYAKADEMLEKYETQACDALLEAGVKVVLWNDADKAKLIDAAGAAVDVWKKEAAKGAGDEAVDEVWDAYSAAVAEHTGETGYTDGLTACAER